MEGWRDEGMEGWGRQHSDYAKILIVGLPRLEFKLSDLHTIAEQGSGLKNYIQYILPFKREIRQGQNRNRSSEYWTNGFSNSKATPEQPPQILP